MRARRLTKEQKENYLKNPNGCPVCRRGFQRLHYPDRISHEDGQTYWEIVECYHCGFTWREIYKLADVKGTGLREITKYKKCMACGGSKKVYSHADGKKVPCPICKNK